MPPAAVMATVWPAVQLAVAYPNSGIRLRNWALVMEEHKPK
jgi:hypothetical protein